MTRPPVALTTRGRYRTSAELAAATPRQLPPLGSDQRIGLPAPVCRSFSSGLRAVAVHDPHAVTVEVQLLLPYTPPTQRDVVLAELVAGTVFLGVDHELRANRTAEWFVVTGHADGTRLEALLRSLTLALTGEDAPGDHVAHVRARLSRGARTAEAHPAVTARTVLDRHRFGDLGCFEDLPAPDVVTALTEADVEAARRRMLSLRGAHLVIVGDIAPESALHMAEAAFGDRSAGKPAGATAPAVRSADTDVRALGPLTRAVTPDGPAVGQPPTVPAQRTREASQPADAPERRALAEHSGGRTPEPLDHLAALCAAPSRAAGETSRSRQENRQVVHRPGALQSHFLMAFPAPGPTHDAYPALALANTVFAGYFSSRLMLRVRERLGLSCHVASSFDQTLGTHSVLLQGACACVHTRTVLSEIRDEWTGMATRPPSSLEVEHARRYQLGMLAALRTSPSALAQFFSTLCCWDIPLDWAEGYADRLRTVSPAEVAAAARTYLSLGPVASVVVGDAAVLTPRLRGDEPR